MIGESPWEGGGRGEREGREGRGRLGRMCGARGVGGKGVENRTGIVPFCSFPSSSFCSFFFTSTSSSSALPPFAPLADVTVPRAPGVTDWKTVRNDWTHFYWPGSSIRGLGAADASSASAPSP